MREDSIDMGNYGVCMDGYPDEPAKYKFFDLPGSYHARACGFSFADGHAELKKWLDPRTTPSLQTAAQLPDIFGSENNVDIAWMQERATRPK
jgi:prepilin-type processing-associated H-X9-DG protein